MTELKTIRKLIITTVPNSADSKVLLKQLVDDKSFEYFVDNGRKAWQTYAAGIIESEK